LPAPILVQGEEAMKDDTGEIFTLDEVATYLKVGKRTVYRLAAAKKIPAFKVGGTWRFQRQEIGQWIKRQTAEAQGEEGRGGPRGENG
jgi:excisionase family DNA binding protein